MQSDEITLEEVNELNFQRLLPHDLDVLSKKGFIPVFRDGEVKEEIICFIREDD